MMTVQATDALAFLHQCWIIFRDDGFADESEQLSWGGLIMFTMVHTLPFQGLHCSWSQVFHWWQWGLEEGFRMKTNSKLVAELFGWCFEIQKLCPYSFPGDYFFKCAMAYMLSWQLLLKFKSLHHWFSDWCSGGFLSCLYIGDGKWYSIALFLRSNIL